MSVCRRLRWAGGVWKSRNSWQFPSLTSPCSCCRGISRFDGKFSSMCTQQSAFRLAQEARARNYSSNWKLIAAGKLTSVLIKISLENIKKFVTMVLHINLKRSTRKVENQGNIMKFRKLFIVRYRQRPAHALEFNEELFWWCIGTQEAHRLQNYK